MSLDVYLKTADSEKCPHCGRFEQGKEVYSANITHNLGKMAKEAGIYEVCWRPEEIGIIKGAQIAEKLRPAIEDMRARPEFYKQFDSPNGWGLYIHFLPWLEKYLVVCEEYPDAVVEVSR